MGQRQGRFGGIPSMQWDVPMWHWCLLLLSAFVPSSFALVLGSHWDGGLGVDLDDSLARPGGTTLHEQKAKRGGKISYWLSDLAVLHRRGCCATRASQLTPRGAGT